MATQLADAGHLAPHAHATPQTVQGSDLMRFAAAGDATLLIGGDLIVTVCQVCLSACKTITAWSSQTVKPHTLHYLH